jgi:hypothetical protein
MARSSTVTSSPEERSLTTRSSISAITRDSVARCSNRRRLTSPVVITWPASMLVTRVIGRNTRRRPGTSTSSPTARGPVSWVPNTATTSRILPTASPSGSKTDRPARRATKTLVGALPFTASG